MTTVRESWLCQILLPVQDNDGRPFPDSVWEEVKGRLVSEFGGITVYRRSPAEGVWAPHGRAAAAEDVFVIEVMTPAFDQKWWGDCQSALQVRLAQEHVVVRAIKLTELLPNHTAR
jgi:hypothetical protein